MLGLPCPHGSNSLRPAVNFMAAMSAATVGVPGFYRPRMPPTSFAADGTEAALSVYDTTPLKATLEELVDFDLINRGQVRLSLGAVNVCKGASVYFDTKNTPYSRGPCPSQWRSAARLRPGHNRWGTLLGRRRGNQHANHLCGGRKTIAQRPHHSGRYLQCRRRPTAEFRRRYCSGPKTSNTRARVVSTSTGYRKWASSLPQAVGC